MTDADDMIEIIEYTISDAAARKAQQARWQRRLAEATDYLLPRRLIETDDEESE